MSRLNFRVWDIEVQTEEGWVYAYSCLGKSLDDVLTRVENGQQRPVGFSMEDVRVKPSDCKIFGNIWS